MTTKTKKVTKAQQAKALAIVAKWLGPRMGCLKPCGKCDVCKSGSGYDWACERAKPTSAPTGDEAAYKGLGPNLVPDFDWTGTGASPAIVLEGGPYDWAVEVSMDPVVVAEMAAIDVFAEPVTGWALGLYPNF